MSAPHGGPALQAEPVHPLWAHVELARPKLLPYVLTLVFVGTIFLYRFVLFLVVLHTL